MVSTFDCHLFYSTPAPTESMAPCRILIPICGRKGNRFNPQLLVTENGLQGPGTPLWPVNLEAGMLRTPPSLLVRICLLASSPGNTWLHHIGEMLLLQGPLLWAAARLLIGWMANAVGGGQSIPPHLAIMTPDSTLRETNG